MSAKEEWVLEFGTDAAVPIVGGSLNGQVVSIKMPTLHCPLGPVDEVYRLQRGENGLRYVFSSIRPRT